MSWLTTYSSTRGTQLARVDEYVVSQAEVRELRDAAPEVVAQHEGIVGLVLNNMPHGHQFRIARELLELARHLRRAQIDPAHHSANERMRAGKLQQPPCLFQTLPCLHGH